ncbi:GGDEF domain-containing protein [Neosynechococcus sphagnicola]|uniref:GGDEF domain-containing protein n=1 Tax=Neosynechococcus sphagnicola TaxID=1501145 RepID=UPI000691D858|nr:GGDEF domain-containing protein [Neosynechococcus sphagnicola]
MATALEMGAAAYLWLTGPQDGRLIRAQVKAGLEQIERCQKLVRMNDLLSMTVMLDSLTEVNNRQAMELKLPQQIQSARLLSQPLSLLMVDLDHFKDINDTYGHLVGDRALKLIAARLQRNLRTGDIPFRYGGDEFVVILSNTALYEAIQVARRLCQMNSEQFLTIDHGLALQITLSVGVTTLQAIDDSDGLSLLQRADQNLLRAKAAGRNQVISCPDF